MSGETAMARAGRFAAAAAWLLVMVSGGVFGMGAGQEASYFKWTDAHGTVHVSATPPPGRKATELKVNESREQGRPDPLATSDTPSSGQVPESDSAPVPDTGPSEEVMQAQADYRRRSCQSAREDAARLDRSAEVAGTHPQDAVARLDAEQRAQARLRAQQRMIQFCGR
jgi:hypothetical protein